MMPTLSEMIGFEINIETHFFSQKAKPDNGVEESLNGGVPGERPVLDVPVARVVLPDQDQHHRHPHPQGGHENHGYPWHEHNDQNV